MMTTMAALLAAVPLAIGQGDGAELRQPLGNLDCGRVDLQPAANPLSTPLVYLYIDGAGRGFLAQQELQGRG